MCKMARYNVLPPTSAEVFTRVSEVNQYDERQAIDFYVTICTRDQTAQRALSYREPKVCGEAPVHVKKNASI